MQRYNKNQEYASYADVYKEKFIYDEETSQISKVEVGADNYNQAHYIFTYYKRNTAGNLTTSAEAVETYVNTYVTEPAKYIELIQFCAYGQSVDGDDNTGTKYSYFTKVNNTNYDKDTINNIQSVDRRMTSHSKACLVFEDNFIDPTTGVAIGRTTWKDAFNVGLLYGLFVYPMAWLVNTFVVLFGSTGWAQVGAILLATLIIKLLIL